MSGFLPPPSEEIIKHKGPSKWIITWSQTNRDVLYGRALNTTNYPPEGPMLMAEHWIKVPINSSLATPRSRPNLIQPCPGCKLHYTYYIGDNRINCILKIPYPRIIKIYACQKINMNQFSSWISGPINTNIKAMKQNHEHYKLLSYNDHLIHYNLIPPNTTLMDALANAIPTNKNYQLITSLIKDRTIQADLWQLTLRVQSSTQFDLYTDGSFRTPSYT